MHIFPLIIIILLINPQFTQLHAIEEVCPSFSCNKHRLDPIQFPFWVPKNQSSRCGYPGFELSCNSDQTLLPFSSNHLTIQGISYPDQLLWGSDPNHCSPKWVLEFASKSPRISTPFNFGNYASPYTFLNCSGGTNHYTNQLPEGTSVISCMSGGNHTVLVAHSDVGDDHTEQRCKVIKSVNAAFWWSEIGYGYYPKDMSNVFVQLSWDFPFCSDCILGGGSCGLLDDFGEVGCFSSASSSGLPKSAKYGLILGAGIPGLLCIIGLTLYASSKVRARDQNRRNANTESSPSIFPQPIILTLGLDGSTIESYPKTILGESKRLPKPSDSMCPICLSDYQPKETLRFIPNCNHYFHADCIDEWLKMNATCPLCRNSPQPPSAFGGC